MSADQPRGFASAAELQRLAGTVERLAAQVAALAAQLPGRDELDAMRLPASELCAHDSQRLMRRQCVDGSAQIRWRCPACGRVGRAVPSRLVPRADMLPQA